MEGFKAVSPSDIEKSAVRLIGSDWMLISAEKDGKINMMTASWGGLGVLWNKPVAFVFIRPQRYTYEFTEAGDEVTLSFFGDGYRDMLRKMGTVSGRDQNKLALSGLTYDLSVPHSPVPLEADTVLRGRKLYADFIKRDSFVSDDVRADAYPGEDYHRVYVYEITEALVRQAR